MKVILNPKIGLLVWMCLSPFSLRGQSSDQEPLRRLNSNAAIITGIPIGSLARYAAPGAGLAYGVGYNFTKLHSVVGEFAWNYLSPTNEALAPLRAASHISNLKGRGDLFSLTANYKLQLEGKTFGLYFLGGAGVYYREVSVSQPISTGNSIGCSATWIWWGFTCSSGTVVENQTLAHRSSRAPGVSVGMGVAVKIPDSSYKVYIETKYIRAGHTVVDTELIPVSVGVRF